LHPLSYFCEKNTMHFKIFWKAYTWTLIIFYLSLAPSDTFPEVGVWNADKLVHTLVYFGQTTLFILAFFRLGPQNKKIYLMLPLAISLFTGTVTELLQGINGIGRHPDWLDMLANTSGSILAIALFPVLQKKVFGPWLKWL
jgi:VanZ family protein